MLPPDVSAGQVNDWVTVPSGPTAANDWITVPHPAATPTSAGAADEYGRSQSADLTPDRSGAVGRVVEAGIQGAKEGFGDPIGQTILTPEAQESLDAKQREGGVGGFMANLGSTVAKDIGTAGGVIGGGLNAAFRGAQGAVAQTGAELGAPQLGRDIAALPEAFMGQPHGLGRPKAPSPAAIAEGVMAAPTIGDAINVATQAASGTAEISPQLRLLQQTEAGIMRRVGGEPGMLTDAENARLANLRGKMADMQPAPAPNDLTETIMNPPGSRPEPATDTTAATSRVTTAQVQARDGVGHNEAVRRAAIENSAAPEPEAMGAAASRQGTPASQLAATPAEAAAIRSQGEIERLAEPPKINDKTIYIPDTELSLAETTGDPVEASLHQYNRQQPEAAAFHTAREDKNGALVANYYADTAGSKPTLERMERDQKTRAAANIKQVFGEPQDVATRAPADTTPTIELMQRLLTDPRQAERDSVVNTITDLAKRLYTKVGAMKTDPYALYGVGEHINDLLRGVGNTETSSAARVLKKELVQVKDSLYDDIERTSPGFAKYRAEYEADARAIEAMKFLQDERLSLLSGSSQMITPVKWSTFMKGVIEGRADPMDPASSLSEAQMDRLWNITDHLKRQTLLDKGKPLGSWTSLMHEIGIRSVGRVVGHIASLATIPAHLGVGNVAVEMLNSRMRSRDVLKEMNRHLHPDLGQGPLP